MYIVGHQNRNRESFPNIYSQNISLFVFHETLKSLQIQQPLGITDGKHSPLAPGSGMSSSLD